MNDVDILCKIAEEIKKVILERYPYGGGGEVIKEGNGGDMTKRIDQIAEGCALDLIDDQGLDWNILSEESGRIDRGGDRTLIFDPIDGTYNAVNGIPLFSTSLALTSGPGISSIEAGVVLDIPNGTCFKAMKGRGSYMDDVKIVTRDYIEKDAVFSSFLGPDSVEDNRRILSWPRRGRYFGSISLEICFVAKGALDIFALFSRVPRITDIAAAHLILLEAGGTHIKIMDSNEWTDYRPGDADGIKGIISIGDKGAVGRIMEISGVEG